MEKFHDYLKAVLRLIRIVWKKEYKRMKREMK